MIADVNEQAGETTVRDISNAGGQAEFVRTDVSSAEECRTLVDGVVKRYGRIDVMHANAGVELCKSIHTTIRMAFNHFGQPCGVFFCCRDALRAMCDGPHAVRSSSRVHLAMATGRDIAAYTSSKGGCVAFVRALALEAAEFGIRANALLPGTTDTPMIRRGGLK